MPLDPDPTTLEPVGIGEGDLVGGYKVLRHLGRGGMGEVFLARDLHLGRKVALKVVREESLGDQRSQERFLHEARVTARFNHPHIVTVYGVGEHQGSLFVALEYLEGQTLRERLDEARLGQRQAVRVALAIAEALTEAHAHGVLHRDLKPQNVLLPRDGRLRVVDFGLAKLVQTGDDAPVPAARSPAEIAALSETLPNELQTLGKGIRGTPQYMAPEQWMEKECTPATDAWAFGVIAYELFTGHHPITGQNLYHIMFQTTGPEPVSSVGELARDLPAPLVALLDRCLAKDPLERPTSEALVAGLEELLQNAPHKRATQASPFRGLEPFGERHADLFFGRDDDIASFLERLREAPVLPVVGPSGVGKSSFVHAGVIPRLRDQGRWLVLVMRPGSQPFERLAQRVLSGDSMRRSGTHPDISMGEVMAPDRHAGSRDRPGSRPSQLAGAGGPEQDSASPQAASTTGRLGVDAEDAELLAKDLREVPGRLALELTRLAEAERARVLVVVDQLEELFTLVRGDRASEIHHAFLQALGQAADDPAGPVRLIATLRDDFLWRVAVSASMSEALGAVTVLRSPGPEALVETLTRPVARSGYHFEDAELPGEMVAEVQGEAAPLPPLQFAAQALWERRDKSRKVLTREAYRAIGGVAGALARHADESLDALTPTQERLARSLFVRLVTPESTRRVVARTALLEGLPAGSPEVLEHFTRSRTILERKGRAGERGAPPKPASGAQGDVVLELVHESLIHHWERLRIWLDESREERVFLNEVGQAAALWHRRGRLDAEVWTGSALADAQRRAARCESLPRQVEDFLEAGGRYSQRLARRRRILAGVGVTLLALVAAGALVFAAVVRQKEREAQRQKRRAVAHEREAHLRRALALREGARAALTRGAYVEARAKLRSAFEITDAPLARALWWRLQRDPRVFTRQFSAWVYDVDFAPGGQQVAVASGNGAVFLIDLRTGHERMLRGGHHGPVLAVAFSPAGHLVASAGRRGEIRLWTLSGGAPRPLRGQRGDIKALAFSPDGTRLASAGRAGSARVWDVRSGRLLARMVGHQGPIRDVQFSPDGARLLTASKDRTARLWDAHTGKPVGAPLAHPARVYAARFSPDGRRVATAAGDGAIRLFTLADRRRVTLPRAHRGRVYALAFRPDGKRLVTAGVGGRLRCWSLAERRLLATVPGHRGAIYRLAYDRRGRQVASVSGDRSLRIWRLTDRTDSQLTGGHKAATGIGFSPDGRSLVSGGMLEGRIRIWDVATGQTRALLEGHAEGVTWTTFGPQGKRVASASADATVRLWDATTGRALRILRGHTGRVYSVAFWPGGKQLASAGSDRTVRLWDPDSGRTLHVLRGHTGSVVSVRYSPDGTLLASTSSDHTIRLWDPATGRAVATLRGHRKRVWSVAFRRDGKRLYSSSNDRTVAEWSLEDPAHPQRLRVLGPLPGRAYWLDLDPTGRWLGVPCSDGMVYLFDLTTGKRVALRGHHDEVHTLRFAPNGRFFATSSDDGTVRLWDLPSGRPRWRTVYLAPKAGEVLTQRGWERLDPIRKGARPSPAAYRWPGAIGATTRRARMSPDGTWLCTVALDGSIALWRRGAKTPRSTGSGGYVERLIALSGGACLALIAGHGLHLVQPGRAPVVLPKVTAATVQGSDLWVAVPGRLVRHPLGRGAGPLTVGPGVTVTRGVYGVSALRPVGRFLAVGFADGGIELHPLAGASRPTFAFEDTPSSAVTRLTAGPMRTLIAGFENGWIGFWSLDNGVRLAQRELHGAVSHLQVHDRDLFAASELGQVLRLDLSAFHRPYCQLLHTLWRQVPVVWASGLPRLRPPPVDHPCRRRR